LINDIFQKQKYRQQDKPHTLKPNQIVSYARKQNSSEACLKRKDNFV